MEEKKPEYKTGAAALFHGHAVQAPAPLWCDVCGKQTVEFVRDENLFERYQCTGCRMITLIAVR